MDAVSLTNVLLAIALPLIGYIIRMVGQVRKDINDLRLQVALLQSKESLTPAEIAVRIAAANQQLDQRILKVEGRQSRLDVIMDRHLARLDALMDHS